MEPAVVVIDVTDQTFESEVIEASYRVPVVVDLWADWCAPCRTLGPVLEGLAVEKAGAFRLAKVDTERNPAIATAMQVQSIPDVRAFREGRQVDGFIGALPEPAVREWLDTLLPSAEDQAAAAAGALEAAGDLDAAETAYRDVLGAAPAHPGATLGLARVFLSTGRAAQVEELLRPLLPDSQAEQLLARARVSAWATLDGDDPVTCAKRAAADGGWRAALDDLLVHVGDDESAREAMLDIFAVLGDDPIVGEYRPRLAARLF